MKDRNAKEARRLMDAFKEIREFFVEIEGSAGEAAAFGFQEFKRGMPKRLDRKDLNFYIARVYPADDICVEKDTIVVRW